MGSLPKSWERTFTGQDFSHIPLLCLPPGKRSPTLTFSLKQSCGWAGCQEDPTPAALLLSGTVPSPYLCEAACASWQLGETAVKRLADTPSATQPAFLKGHQAAFVQSVARTSLQTLFWRPANIVLANWKIKIQPAPTFLVPATKNKWEDTSEIRWK